MKVIKRTDLWEEERAVPIMELPFLFDPIPSREASSVVIALRIGGFGV